MGYSWLPSEDNLHGGKNETFHFGETGWLKDDDTYSALRTALDKAEVLFREIDLNELETLDPLAAGCDRHIVFISNADANPKFLGDRAALERRLAKSSSVIVVSSQRITLVDEGLRGPAKVLAERVAEARSKDDAPEASEKRVLALQAAVSRLRAGELLSHLRQPSQRSLPQGALQVPSEDAVQRWWRLSQTIRILQL
eukprot:TRINITY_DN34411_c0_g1_i3.p1 TRINITY_DN34411_c0_g1~~TRINITY_DN34411_c0_g1_i3.p1  ORF type:complete len:198 (-),score=33.06 TRINITY_DN34411_c0_g1_i3:569-1162(-)